MNIKKDNKTGNIVISGIKLEENSILKFSFSQEELNEIVRFAELQDTIDGVRNFMQDIQIHGSLFTSRLQAKQLLNNEKELEKFARLVQEKLDNGNEFLSALGMVSERTFPFITERDIRENNMNTMRSIAEMLGWDFYASENDCDLEFFSPDGELVNIPLRYDHFCEDVRRVAEEFDLEKEIGRQLSLAQYCDREYRKEAATAIKQIYDQLANAFALAERIGLPEV